MTRPQLIRPWLRGRDISRWKANWAGLYLISIQNSGDQGNQKAWASASTEARAREVFYENYPAIHDHLQKFEQGLRRRADQGRFWWELRPCAYYHELSQPKIIWGDIVPSPRFLWDEEGFFTDTTIFQCVGASKAELAILNSHLAEFLLRFICPTVRGGYLRLKIQYVELLPIPVMDDNTRDMLALLVDRVIQGSGEDELNDLVLSAFRLSRDERRALGDWLAERKATIEPPPDDEGMDNGE
jgi:hypothetical protein